MEDTNLGLLVLRGRGSFETLTAEEKPRFKTAQERLNLELLRARIRTQFKYWLSYPYSWHDPIKPTS
jgi:hypothetical protein